MNGKRDPSEMESCSGGAGALKNPHPKLWRDFFATAARPKVRDWRLVSAGGGGARTLVET